MNDHICYVDDSLCDECGAKYPARPNVMVLDGPVSDSGRCSRWVWESGTNGRCVLSESHTAICSL